MEEAARPRDLAAAERGPALPRQPRGHPPPPGRGGELGLVSWPQYSPLIGLGAEYCGKVICDWSAVIGRQILPSDWCRWRGWCWPAACCRSPRTCSPPGWPTLQAPALYSPQPIIRGNNYSLYFYSNMILV